MNPLEHLKSLLERTRQEVRRVIIGQDRAVDLCLTVILANQHALLEGVPGIAKTLLVRTLGRVLGSDFGRVQFTPDLMPTDITGTTIYNPQKGEFTLARGPVFTSFLLADEINRAPAKTQAALLQAMQERIVTIDRESHPLPANFTVFATQNPIEFEGTYPLPEAQKDRFMLKIDIGFPDRDSELTLAQRLLDGTSPESVLASGQIQPILTGEQLEYVRPVLQQIVVRPEIVTYVVDVIRATRTQESVLVGAGPRGTQALLAAARIQAVLDNRDFVTPDDVKRMAQPVLAHRLVLRPEFEIEGLTTSEVVEKLLQDTPVPR